MPVQTNDVLYGTAAELADLYIAPGKFAYAHDTEELVIGPGTFSQTPSIEPRGGRLLTSAKTSAQTAVSTGSVQIPGTTIEFTVGSRPVLVEATAPWNTAGTGVTSIVASLNNGTSTATASIGKSLANGQLTDLIIRELITDPGQYTRRFEVGRGGSGTITVGAGTTTTAVLVTATET